MMEVGRLCVKIAGRDAGKKCVIVEVIDDKFVMIDGETRRRKCNTKHLEPSKEMIKLGKGADHSAVKAEFKKLGIELKETKQKPAKPKKKQARAAEKKKLAPKEEKKKAVKPKKEKPAAEAKAAEAEKPEEKTQTKTEAEAPETKLEKAVGEEK